MSRTVHAAMSIAAACQKPSGAASTRSALTYPNHCGATANDNAGTLLSGSGDRRFVFALDR
jgi:hypothetical protein